MESKIVFDVKQADWDVIIPTVAVHGLAFEDKLEADKFIKKYYSTTKNMNSEQRAEKAVFATLEEFEKSLKTKLSGLKKQLMGIKLLEKTFPNEDFNFDKAYLEYSILNIEKFLDSGNASELFDEREPV